MSYKLLRLKCDSCGKSTAWQLMPEGAFPHPKGWVLHQKTQLCEPCFMKTVPKRFKDHAYDLGERVREKRQGMCDNPIHVSYRSP